MRNPFLLDLPAVVSFSGGRTSGYMVYRILESFRAIGPLPDMLRFVFCNTGKERLETLDFIERCSQRWGFHVDWLEYLATPSGKYRKKDGKELWNHSHKSVNYATANRTGKPFENVIQTRQFLPNATMRFCTGELKIKTTNRFVRHGLGWPEYLNALGLRHDEPARVAKALATAQAATTFVNLFGEEQENDDEVANTHPPGEEVCCPLDDARVDLQEVMDFWKVQRGGIELSHWLAMPKADRPGWDLELRTDEGNCDLCFMKGADKVFRLIAENQQSAGWWIEQEAKIGKTKSPGTDRFRADRPSYARMLELAQGGQEPLWQDVDLRPCHCTD